MVQVTWSNSISDIPSSIRLYNTLDNTYCISLITHTWSVTQNVIFFYLIVTK